MQDGPCGREGGRTGRWRLCCRGEPRAHHRRVQGGLLRPGQAQRLGQQLQRGALGHAAGTPLQVADGALAQAGALGQLRLRQAGCDAIALEQLAKSQSLRCGHGPPCAHGRATADAAEHCPAALAAIIIRLAPACQGRGT